MGVPVEHTRCQIIKLNISLNINQVFYITTDLVNLNIILTCVIDIEADTEENHILYILV